MALRSDRHLATLCSATALLLRGRLVDEAPGAVPNRIICVGPASVKASVSSARGRLGRLRGFAPLV
jgi:hypothetical protein